MDDINSSIATKTCSTCKVEQPTSNFSKKTRLKDGLNGQCKSCCSKSFRAFYERNAEAQRNRTRQYVKDHPLTPEKKEELRSKRFKYWSDNREEIARRRKEAYEANPSARKKNANRASEWYCKNKDRQLIFAKDYYKNNSEAIKSRVREYEKANPEKTKILGRIKANRRRARLSTSVKHYTRIDVERIFKLQKGKCASCGGSIKDKFHIDHRIPVAKGGDNSPYNIDLLCPSCNMRKSSKLPHEFAQENGRLI